MKLFIWSNPYKVNYGSSMLFAVAETLEQAKELAITSKSYCYNEYPNMKGNINISLKDPIRILDLPCAEWHEWSE
jgi:hypothetical protein